MMKGEDGFKWLMAQLYKVAGLQPKQEKVTVAAKSSNRYKRLMATTQKRKNLNFPQVYQKKF